MQSGAREAEPGWIASRLWVHARSLVPALLLDWTLALGVNQLLCCTQTPTYILHHPIYPWPLPSEPQSGLSRVAGAQCHGMPHLCVGVS